MREACAFGFGILSFHCSSEISLRTFCSLKKTGRFALSLGFQDGLVVLGPLCLFFSE